MNDTTHIYKLTTFGQGEVVMKELKLPPNDARTWFIGRNAYGARHIFIENEDRIPEIGDAVIERARKDNIILKNLLVVGGVNVFEASFQLCAPSQNVTGH
eukprot:TRINITY_DN7795_c0_g1_i1.p1 TRINITY_DN7795_c0_g1~~TRINITY_DN7795_c0_g1_i1.p1  ORF type:complete len:100 (-),score=14.82 TRINITY_DN7795_c0_g1_i1:208-507(-)